jgi:CRISPR-associated protein Cmr2
MSWEHCVSIAECVSRIRQIAREKEELRKKFAETCNSDLRLALSSQFVDWVTVWWFRNDLPRRDDARHEVYVPVVKGLTIQEPGKICEGIDFRPNFSQISSSSWLGLEVDFELLTPWYSRDDRVFHVLDNPVRKDRLFGVPYMSAASWKGMLRWACRMQAGLREHLQNGKSFEDWNDPPWVLHLFGHERAKSMHEEFRQGALVFYPTWFDRIGFEVINPHSRRRRAGTQPIHYEVVPPGARGTLSLLYAPLPGAARQNGVTATEAIEKLLKAVRELLTTYGISARRTVGWGTAKIERWKAYRKDCQPIEKPNLSEFWSELQTWFSSEVGP